MKKVCKLQGSKITEGFAGDEQDLEVDLVDVLKNWYDVFTGLRIMDVL